MIGWPSEVPATGSLSTRKVKLLRSALRRRSPLLADDGTAREADVTTAPFCAVVKTAFSTLCSCAESKLLLAGENGVGEEGSGGRRVAGELSDENFRFERRCGVFGGSSGLTSGGCGNSLRENGVDFLESMGLGPRSPDA